MHSVYQIRNIDSGMRYFGMTRTTLAQRMNAHIQAAKRKADTSYLHNAIRAHGADKFEIKMIHECETRALAAELERFIIEEANSQHPGGYNLRTGGDGGYAWHPDSKERARKNTKAYFEENPQARLNVSAKVSEVWKNPAMRQKYIDAAKKRSSTPEQRAELAARAALGRERRWAAYRSAKRTA